MGGTERNGLFIQAAVTRAVSVTCKEDDDYLPDSGRLGTINLDNSTANSGSHSMRVTAGAAGYCGHVFFGTTKIPSSDVYIRVYLYVYSNTLMQCGSICIVESTLTSPDLNRKALKALTQNHISFIIMPDSAQGSNKHLRIGGQDEVLTYNRESDDAVLPDLSSQGITNPTLGRSDKADLFLRHRHLRSIAYRFLAVF